MRFEEALWLGVPEVWGGSMAGLLCMWSLLLLQGCCMTSRVPRATVGCILSSLTRATLCYNYSIYQGVFCLDYPFYMLLRCAVELAMWQLEDSYSSVIRAQWLSTSNNGLTHVGNPGLPAHSEDPGFVPDTPWIVQSRLAHNIYSSQSRFIIILL